MIHDGRAGVLGADLVLEDDHEDLPWVLLEEGADLVQGRAQIRRAHATALVAEQRAAQTAGDEVGDGASATARSSADSVSRNVASLASSST
jgi:hypothetical protein